MSHQNPPHEQTVAERNAILSMADEFVRNHPVLPPSQRLPPSLQSGNHLGQVASHADHQQQQNPPHEQTVAERNAILSMADEFVRNHPVLPPSQRLPPSLQSGNHLGQVASHADHQQQQNPPHEQTVAERNAILSMADEFVRNHPVLPPSQRLPPSLQSGNHLAQVASHAELIGQSRTANTTLALNNYCTCGRCAGGWLSPRMRFRLQAEAEFWADSMPMGFDGFTQGQPVSPGTMMDNPSRFIPPSLRHNFRLEFYKGYCDVLRATSLLLSTSGDVLSVAAVMPFITKDQNSDFFFKNGGRIKYAFASITSGAQDASPLGDNTFADTFDNYADWISLPTCTNDLKFQLVRQMIGLDRNKEWGPYDLFYARMGMTMAPVASDEEVEGEDDSEEEEDDE
ncbi:hypothetical protein B0H16DRAFT_1812708 [Mycena metata]|uniref:Uncharacterized protein n=1 Tax=Mycena metata TaxID=1033252 RepID=A0AAD7JEQ8_9AGAR|nr:hypothetical protein B0H16DRAFT_1812708 [Mycena metata]